MRRTLLATLMLVTATVVALSREATVQAQPSADQLPRAFEIPGVKPEVLARTEVPNVPGRLLIVSRTTSGAKADNRFDKQDFAI